MGEWRPHGRFVVQQIAGAPPAAYRAAAAPAALPARAPGPEPLTQAPVPAPAERTAGRLSWARRDSVYRRSLAAADALAALCALLVSIAVVPRHSGSLAILATVPLIVAMSKLIGTYDREDLLVRKSSLDEVPELFQLATLYALTAWIIERLLIGGPNDPRSLVALWLALTVLIVLFRAIARTLSRFATSPERCLVIGDEAMCDSMRVKFSRQRSLHAVVVGQIPHEDVAAEAGSPPSLVRADAIQGLAVHPGVDRVILAPGAADEDGVTKLVRHATSLGLKVSLLPRVLEAVGSSAAFDDLEGVPLLSIRPLGLPRSSWAIKRAVDILGSTLGLLVTAPFLAIVALGIKLDSRGPLLFRQQRIGRDGKPFSMLKFRTMLAGADERKGQLDHLNEAEGLFKIRADPRVTRVGRLIRRTSLDELPQLVNVLRGEMSLVGPRPLIPEEDSRIEGWHRRRLHLMPGMTGHWQVLGSARIPLSEMVRIDYLYVTNWSLWLDVKIVLRTIPYVLGGKGQ
jgi:exopolysaccharide biosynthesis polyprenyl glycosylphosphotransferase